MSSPRGAADQDHTAQARDRSNDCIKIAKAELGIAGQRPTNARTVLIAQVPGDNIPYRNVAPDDARFPQLRPKVRRRAVGVVKGNHSGLERLRTGSCENE